MAGISLVLGFVMRPKVRDTSEPATLKDFSAPTASENRPIPVIWGTVKLTGPNVTWYGDLQTVKLMNKKAKVGLGYRYSVGMELGLCHGPIDGLLEIGFGDKSAWTGNVVGGTGSAEVTGENFIVDNRTLFGGDSDEQLQNGGYGGVFAECTFYKGAANQQSNTYLSNILSTDNPGHSGVSYLVWNGPTKGNIVYNYDLANPSIRFDREPFLGGYIGTNPRIDDIWFVLKRIPRYIESNDGNNYHDINSGDANPIDVIYELLTNSKFGLGLASSFIDLESFRYAQKKIYEEGLGLSDIWESDKKISEVLNEILQYIDGVVYTNLKTGQLTIKLARNDYEINNLPVFDASSISEIGTYSSPSVDETTNQIQLSYIDRLDKFKSKITVAHDLANARSQNEVVSASISYIGISNGAVANKIAFRDLRVLSYPLDKITFTTNRRGTIIRPSDVFVINWPEYGFSNKVFRAIKVSYGELVNGICEIDAIEDVFSVGLAVYGANDDSSWEDPIGVPTKPTNVYALEAPTIYSANSSKLLVAVAKPNAQQLSFNSFASINSPTGTYAQIGTGDNYTPTGLLNISYSSNTLDVDPTGITITPSNPNGLIFLQNFPSEYIKTNNNLALITDGVKEEFIAFENVVKSGNNYVLTNVWRGLLDTVPQNWSSGSRIWFIDYGVAEPDQAFNGTDTVYIKTQSNALNGQSSIQDVAQPFGVILRRRALKPYPPGHFKINGSTTTTNITAGSDIVVSWEHRNRTLSTFTKQYDTGISPEDGTKYYLKFFNQANALIKTVTLDSPTTTYTYLNTDQVADNNGTEPKVVTVHLYSHREGLFSLYNQSRTLIRPTGVVSGSPSYSPGADTYTPIPDGSASSLNGVRVTGTPSNNQVLTYNSTSGNWEPSTPSSNITLNGDVTGVYNSNTVTKIRNKSVSTSEPVAGDVLTWNAVSGWTPTQPSTPSVTLSGDVTGSSSSNTVTKIQGRSVLTTVPTDGQTLTWSSADNAWKPSTSSGSSNTGQPLLTYYSNTAQNITVDNTWTTITDMELNGSTTYLANWAVTFTCVIGATSADNEKFEFRFLLNNTVASESWYRAKDAAVANSEKHLVTIHTVFENLAANSIHNFKVQFRDYSGSSVNVSIVNRRVTAAAGKSSFDPNFTPASLTGLQYWFKADSLGLSNGAYVEQLTDYSSNNRHFVKATGSAQGLDARGTLVTNQINGLPAVKFNHTGAVTDTQYNGTGFLVGSAAAELFIVIKAASNTSDNSKNVFGQFSTVDDANLPLYPINTGTIYETFGSNYRRTGISYGSVNISSWNLYNVAGASNDWLVKLNGTTLSTSSTNTAAFRTNPWFGGNGSTSTSGNGFGYGFDGHIAEVIIYNYKLTSAERSNIQTYISSKYGITITN